MNFNLDVAVHLAELLMAVPVLWKANRALNRYLDERENYPPHLHVNGKILFPKGLKPKDMQETH
jgi:hypothetical protein